MALSIILAPLRGDGNGWNILSHAAAVGRRHNAHIRAVHSHAKPSDMIPYGVVVPAAFRKQIEIQATNLATAEEAELQRRYQAHLDKLGLERINGGTPPRDRMSASWLEEEGRQIDVIKRHGRLVDLVVVAKPSRDRNLGVNSLRAALFATGRPVMVCPPSETAPDDLGRRVSIAWNGSAEASRAVALAMPILRAADGVIVLDGGDDRHGTSGKDLMEYLEACGIQAEHETINAARHPGRAIMTAAGEADADLVVMGAYSRSREQEMIFGGATQEVIDECIMPVVMVH